MTETSIKKITIIGAGFVGSTTAYTLMVSGLVSEIVLVDINKDKADGEIMDMNHGMPFVRPVQMYAGDYSDASGSDIVIITAGANQKEGETRIDLAQKNTEIFKNIVSQVIKYAEDAILLVVTNPVDILTYVTLKVSGLPKNKVIGSGTVLDTSRFKYLIGKHVGIDPRNVHAYILGEHGDSEVAAWSISNIAGVGVGDYCKNYCHRCEDSINMNNIYKDVKNAAYEIIKRKGATYYAVALAVRRVVEAIIRNESSILTVSSFLEGQYGITDVALSLPSVVNSNGIEKIISIPLSLQEEDRLRASANMLKKTIENLKF